MDKVVLDGHSLTIDQLDAIARGARVELAEAARARLRPDPTKGALRQKWVWLGAGPPPDDPQAVVRAFVETHCGGMGEPLDPTDVRAIMAARANVVAIGVSGCRPDVIDAYLAFLNADVIPVVPRLGSVGAAAPAPLAHIARIVCGYGGDVWFEGKRMRLDQVPCPLPTLRPTEKEALSLVNGATMTTALAGRAVFAARQLLHTAEAACALSFEVVRADPSSLDARAHALRGHPGAIDVAERLRTALQGSQLVTEGRHPDPFSIRCAPAVLGAAWEAWEYVDRIVHRELNAACDNPLILGGKRVEVGHFHAAPVALAMDHLKTALTTVCTLSERRIFRLTYGQLSGLPSFLVAGTGLNSGLMLAQYTAASLTSECKGLAHPASVDTIPTVQHREDHVSMGPIAARGALHITELLADVLAIELLCAAQGLDFHIHGEAVDDNGQPLEVNPLFPASSTRATYDRVRSSVQRWRDDRVLHTDLQALGDAVRSGLFANVATG